MDWFLKSARNFWYTLCISTMSSLCQFALFLFLFLSLSPIVCSFYIWFFIFNLSLVFLSLFSSLLFIIILFFIDNLSKNSFSRRKWNNIREKEKRRIKSCKRIEKTACDTRIICMYVCVSVYGCMYVWCMYLATEKGGRLRWLVEWASHAFTIVLYVCVYYILYILHISYIIYI